jgi:hypothetical protein
MQWDMPLSLCEWTLKVVKYRNFALDQQFTPSSLIKLSKTYQANDLYEPLRRFFQEKATWAEIWREWEASGEEEALKPSNLVKALMDCVLSTADVLAITPHACRDGMYWRFIRAHAKISVCDEAASTTIPGVLLAWPDFRPLIFAGDKAQLPPAVMTLHQKKGDYYVNSFAQHLAMSFLDRIQDSGWPVFTMPEQLRIVRGRFDLAREVFYPGLPELYSEACDVSRREKARVAEAWLRGVYSNLRNTPGKVQPAFIHHEGRCSTNDSTLSRLNTDQAEYAIQLLR